MGWWNSEHGMIGDLAADFANEFYRHVQQSYQEMTGRLPTQGEVADLIEFASCGVFKVQTGKVDHPFDLDTVHDPQTPKATKPGQQGALGEFANCRPGEMVNVDPKTGDHYEKGEVTAILQSQFEEQALLDRIRRGD